MAESRLHPAADYGRVAVLMGGQSAERAISLKSGQAVLNALQRLGIAAVGVDVGPDVLAKLSAGDFQRAVIMLHGRGGEDGVIQGALETLGLPYTGSGVLASALAMDKLMSKRLWLGLGLPTPASCLLTAASEPAAVVAALGLPLFVKPTLEGSSLGMTKVKHRDELPAAYAAAAPYGPVLAETCIAGDEYTFAILDTEVLPAIRLRTPHEFYDFDAKYQATDTGYDCPAGLAPEQERRLGALARQAFEALGACGWGRVDIMVDAAGQGWLLEVNTIPGMTDHSLVPMAAQARGLSFAALAERILATSLTPLRAR